MVKNQPFPNNKGRNQKSDHQPNIDVVEEVDYQRIAAHLARCKNGKEELDTERDHRSNQTRHKYPPEQIHKIDTFGLPDIESIKENQRNDEKRQKRIGYKRWETKSNAIELTK